MLLYHPSQMMTPVPKEAPPPVAYKQNVDMDVEDSFKSSQTKFQEGIVYATDCFVFCVARHYDTHSVCFMKEKDMKDIATFTQEGLMKELTTYRAPLDVYCGNDALKFMRDDVLVRISFESCVKV